MEKCLRYLLAGLLLVSFPAMAAGAAMESSISHRRFTTADGLPQMQTETVWQDTRGYIYIGTLSGFVRYDGRTMTPFLGGRRENIVAFQETEGKVSAFGFVRKWTFRGEKLDMKPIDPEGRMLLNNFNSADLPPGYVLLEDRREQGRVLFHLEAGGRVCVLESPLLDEMTPDRKLYLDSLGVFIPTPEGLYVADGGKTRKIGTQKDVFSLIRRERQLIALSGDGLLFVPADEIAGFRADGNYATLVTFKREEMILESLLSLERRLPDCFARADRRTIVNIRKVHRLNPQEQTCTLQGPDGAQTVMKLSKNGMDFLLGRLLEQ